MRRAIKAIDRALKHLYNVDIHYRAEHFLVNSIPSEVSQVANKKKVSKTNYRGALLVKGSGEEMSLGIYLDENVQTVLESFSRWKNREWTLQQTSAFATAAEEVSHFHYLLFHSHRGRSVSQFEMELQAEIDKFFLTYFAQGESNSERFEQLFEQFFWHCHFELRLSPEEKARYQNASQLARHFVGKLRPVVIVKPNHALEKLRKFYRLGSAEKVSLIQSLM